MKAHLLSDRDQPFHHQGRLTDLIETGKLFADLGLPPLNPEHDRAMICGSSWMLKDTCVLLNALGVHPSPRAGEPGDYVIERAFARTVSCRLQAASGSS